jgi:hypothetical protein
MNTIALWLLGFDIDPKVLEEEPLATYIKEKDGADSFRQLQSLRYKYTLPGKSAVTFDSRHQLEFMVLVDSGGTEGINLF